MDTFQLLLLIITLIAGIIAIVFWLITPPEHGVLTGLAPNETYSHNHWPEQGFANLPDGKTNYWLVGPIDGKRIVFVHGINPTPLCVSVFIDELAKNGFRVLCYEQYGRGYSDSPPAIYNEAFLINQLVGLVHYLEFTNSDILGYSLGGAIACGAVHFYPKLFKNVVFVAPAGILKKLPSPKLAALMKTPILGKLFFHLIGVKMLIKLSASNHYLSPIECPAVVRFG